MRPNKLMAKPKLQYRAPVVLLSLSLLSPCFVLAEDDGDWGRNGAIVFLPSPRTDMLGVGTKAPMAKLDIVIDQETERNSLPPFAIHRRLSPKPHSAPPLHTDFIVDDTGRVGIGTDKPTGHLSIKKGDKVVGLVVDASDGDGAWFNVNDANGGPALFLTSNSDKHAVLKVSGAGAEAAISVLKGFVEVNGKIFAEDIQISPSSTWPDDVFSENYRLMTLPQLEQLVRRERHLPGFPSARQIGEQGFSLGQMQSDLLRKIEELTIYVIELHKQLEEVRLESRDLRQRIETRNPS